MGMDRFYKWLPTQGPEWLGDANGLALKRALGSALDYQQGRMLQGLLARYPTKGNVDAAGSFGPPPSDALDQQGLDRQLRRGPAESDAAYGARVQTAWDAWVFAGSHYGVLRALQLAGYADMVIVQQNGRYAYLAASTGDITDLAFGTLMTCAPRPGDPPGWMFDARDDFYSQFGIVFTADHPNLSSASGQAILLDIVKQWKPGKGNFVAAWVIVAGVLLGWPTGRTLGTDPNLGGNTIRTITP